MRLPKFNSGDTWRRVRTLLISTVIFVANNPFGGETESNPFQKASTTSKQIFGGPTTEKTGFTNGLNFSVTLPAVFMSKLPA